MPCKQNPILILYLKEAPSKGTGEQGDKAPIHIHHQTWVILSPSGQVFNKNGVEPQLHLFTVAF